MSNWRKSAYVSTVILSLLILATLCPISFSSNTPVEAATGTAQDSILTFNATSSTASVSLNVTSTSGSTATSSTSQDNDERAKFTISTNNVSGYELKIKASSSTNLSNGTDTIGAIGTNGIALNTFPSNTWGYTPNYYNSTANTNNLYYPITTTDVTLNKTSTANSTNGIDNANSYTIGLGLKADYTKSAGTYTNTTAGGSIVLSYVANPVSYTINYNKGNTTDTVTNMPATQSSSVSETSITLSSTVPARTGYDFKGWCLGTVTTTNNTDACSGTIYNPNGAGTNLTYGIDKTTTNTATLHAMWNIKTVAVTVNFAGEGVTGVTFTNSTYGNINITTSGNTANLKYGVQYTIAGTYNNNYEFDSWSNTAGTIGSTTSASTTYSTTTAATLTLTGKSSKIYMQDMTLAECQKNVGTNGNAANIGDNITVYDKRASNYGSGDDASYTVRYINGLCWMTQNLRVTGTLAAADSNFAGGNVNISVSDLTVGNSYTEARTHVGTDDIGGSTVWYNYCAASAGTVCTDSNSNAVTSDICPAGWHLPSDAANVSSSDFYALFQTTATGWQNTNDYLTAFGAVAGGRYKGGKIGNTYYGSYWTTAYSSTTNRYYLLYDNRNNEYKSEGLERIIGRYIRCVKTTPKITVTFAGSGVSSVKVCTTSGNCSGSNLKGTISSSGGSVSGLENNTTYYLYPTFSTGYQLSSWSKTSSTGTLSSTSATNPTFTMGSGDGAVTITGKAKTFNLVVTGDSNVSSLTVKKGSTSGTSTTCTKSSNTFTCSSLEYGTKYYLYPVFATGYTFNSWAKTDSATNASLGSTSTVNTYYQMGNGAGALTLSTKVDLIDYCAQNGIANSNCMQKMTFSDCPTGGKTVTDSRDGSTYTVKKLSDNKCWMTENLAIDLVDSKNNLISANTNATDQALGYLKGTTTGTSSDQWAMAAVSNWTSTSYSYSQPWIAVDSSTSGVCSDASTWCVTTTGAWSWDIMTPATINGTTSKAQGKLGVYYNYCAASAGSYCWGNGTSTTGSPSSDPNTSSLRDITSDICPYGWRLPTSTSSGEFQALYTAYSSNSTNFQTALSTPLSGYFYNGKAYVQGNYGYFWSSTWSSKNNMYLLRANPTSVYPSNTFDRYYGYSVRCVYDPPTMQDATATSLATAMPNNGDTTTLRDARDGQDYTIAKINGAYWMTRNLAIGCNGSGSTYGDTISSKTLTDSDSNISATSWSTPTLSLDKNDNTTNCTTSSIYSCSSNTDARMKCSSTYGAWYNYAAATAGTIATSSTETVDTYNICPKGWTLPANGTSAGQIGSVTSYKNYFSPVAGGNYNIGAINDSTYGNWWSTTVYNDTNRYTLSFNGSSLSTSANARRIGYYIRCIKL